MQIVPLQLTPSQNAKVLLSNQQCSLNVYQKTYGMFMDVYVSSSPVATGILCLNKKLIVRYPYLGFIGDFVFADFQGSSDPDYTGLGLTGRFQLVYLSAADIDSAVAATV